MKYAICIGINEYDQAVYGAGSNLHQCVRDAYAMRLLLVNRGFSVEMMMDAYATVDKITEALREYAKMINPGDTLVITQSSHGTYLDLPMMKRATGLCMHDSVWWDWEQAGVWKSFKEGVKIVRIMDSCFSESNFRAPMGPGVQARYMAAPTESLLRKPTNASMRGAKCSIVSMSSSSISQPSYENAQGGVFTQMLTTLVNTQPGLTYKQLQKEMDRMLKQGGWAQTPKLEVVNAKVRSTMAKFGE